jgi:hypothetical protein
MKLSSSSKSLLPTNQKFGLFFTAVFVVVAVYSHFKVSDTFSLVALAIALLFAAITLLSPHQLGPLNLLWYKLGMLLGKIVSPIVLGIIFFLLITPISLFTRLFGRDELRLRKRNAESYWINRVQHGSISVTFKNQY